jgi:hypothetical protein
MTSPWPPGFGSTTSGEGVQTGSFYKVTLAIKRALKEKIQDATDSTVRIMSNAMGAGTHLPSDYRSFIISPSTSITYDQSAFAGGGAIQVTARCAVVVTAKVPGSLDDVDEIENWFKRQEQTRVELMSALCGLHLYDEDGILITNEVLFPREAAWNKDKTMGDVMVAFDIEFDELITTPDSE